MSPFAKIQLALLALALGACRGGTSHEPPVHLVLDMDFQPKLKAQSAAMFDNWEDGRGMRLPVAGTVAGRGGPGPGPKGDPHKGPPR